MMLLPVEGPVLKFKFAVVLLVPSTVSSAGGVGTVGGTDTGGFTGLKGVKYPLCTNPVRPLYRTLDHCPDSLRTST